MRFSRKAKRELSWILLSLSCLILTYNLVFGEGGLAQLRQYRLELETIRNDNLRLRQQHHQYIENIHRIKTDPYEVERIARERYNFARPGDIIVNLPR